MYPEEPSGATHCLLTKAQETHVPPSNVEGNVTSDVEHLQIPPADRAVLTTPLSNGEAGSSPACGTNGFDHRSSLPNESLVTCSDIVKSRVDILQLLEKERADHAAQRIINVALKSKVAELERTVMGQKVSISTLQGNVSKMITYAEGLEARFRDLETIVCSNANEITDLKNTNKTFESWIRAHSEGDICGPMSPPTPTSTLPEDE